MDDERYENKKMPEGNVKNRSMKSKPKAKTNLIRKGGKYSKKYQINADLRDHKRGDTPEFEVDKSGKLKDVYWRKRLEEAKRDNCIVEIKGVK